MTETPYQQKSQFGQKMTRAIISFDDNLVFDCMLMNSHKLISHVYSLTNRNKFIHS